MSVPHIMRGAFRSATRSCRDSQGCSESQNRSAKVELLEDVVDGVRQGRHSGLNVAGDVVRHIVRSVAQHLSAAVQTTTSLLQHALSTRSQCVGVLESLLKVRGGVQLGLPKRVSVSVNQSSDRTGHTLLTVQNLTADTDTRGVGAWHGLTRDVVGRNAARVAELSNRARKSQVMTSYEEDTKVLTLWEQHYREVIKLEGPRHVGTHEDRGVEVHGPSCHDARHRERQACIRRPARRGHGL